MAMETPVSQRWEVAGCDAQTHLRHLGWSGLVAELVAKPLVCGGMSKGFNEP